MEKFKELSLDELYGTNGGMDELAMQPFHDASETWWWKGLIALNDAADFISGVFSGLGPGFDNSSKNW